MDNCKNTKKSKSKLIYNLDFLVFICASAVNGKTGRKEQTSEKVKEVVLGLFLLAAVNADIAPLAFVANGTKIKEMKKDGTVAD